MKKIPVGKNKMRGIVDPLTLGFLIVLIGGGLMHKVYDKDKAEKKQAKAEKVIDRDTNGNEKEDF